ncbi:MAG: glycosyltransferase family 4 protein, partial [Myxococcota bacterium]|nr:glycosyltransferase family 4 protein [Myxococcota bacterium]
NGVDTQRFHPKNRRLFFLEAREEFHLVPEDTVMLFVGGDFERKGLDSAIRVLGALQERSDLKLLVVGHDRRFERFMGLAQQLGVLEQVHLTGVLDRIERVYATADLLLLPTRYDPFANVTLEALASEVPVVTTGTNGAAEVLRSCESVSIIDDPEDVEGMVNAVRAFLDHPDQERLRRAAREAALQNRDEDNYREVESIYRQIAAGGSRKARP